MNDDEQLREEVASKVHVRYLELEQLLVGEILGEIALGRSVVVKQGLEYRVVHAPVRVELVVRQGRQVGGPTVHKTGIF